MKKPFVVAICSSLDFYRFVIELQKQLEDRGFEVIIPSNARLMKQTGDFEPSHYKTWFANANDYHKKGQLIREHFQEIEKADAILVVNLEKHGQPNYIGGNVLLEMGIAFYLHKPIYIFNDIPADSPYAEEIRGFGPIVLQGNTLLIK